MAISKLFFSTIATVLISIASATQAQQPPISAPTPSSKTQPSAVPVLTTPTKQDLKLLSKAAGIFWQTDRSETESKVRFQGVRDGIKVDSTIDVKTITQTGGKFRAQLIFTPIGSTTKAT
jgi:hypothetical protein